MRNRNYRYVGNPRATKANGSVGVSAAVREVSQAIVDWEKLKDDEVEALLKLADDIIRRDYWSDVRSIGNEIVQRVKDGELTSSEDVEQAVHEGVEGTQLVIYTHQARRALSAVDNPDAYEDDTGEKPESVEAQLAFVMMNDVNGYLRGFDEVSELD